MADEKKLNGTVIVTYRCNARCSMCNRYKAPSKPEEEISIETIKKLPKMYFTNITGGEPFIRTDLKEIVRELYKKSDRIVISTNGFFTDRIVGLDGDYVGGLFGTIQGCNGALTIFLNIAISYFIAGYLCGNEKLIQIVIHSILYFLVAAVSETKGNYIFFLLIVAVALLVSKKSLKTFGIICVAFISLVVGMYLLNKYFPGSLVFLLNLNEANSYMSASYFGTVTFTRNAALSVANKVFFKDNMWLYLFGYGIGACDTSSFFSSPFYDMYGYMNYRLLSSSMTLLQNGYTGLAIYFLFFIYMFILGLFKSGKSQNSNTKQVMIMTCCLAAFGIGYSFYSMVKHLNLQF